MAKAPDKIRLEIHTVPGYTKGQVVTVPAVNGVPRDKFWRDRIKDSEYDNCLTVLKGKQQPTGSDKE